MRIIHYISELKEHDLVADYVSALSKALESHASVEVYTQAQRSELFALSAPDIVHVHGCWDWSVSRVAHHFAKRGIPVVLSPHGALDSYAMTHEQRIGKLLQAWMYQCHTVKRAHAVILTTEDERQQVLRLKWQDRTAMMKNPLLDSHTSFSTVAAEMIRFYQKVIDTSYRSLMTPKEKEAVCLLLREGITDDAFSTPLNQSQRDLLSSLHQEQWRRLLLYADDEDISLHVDKAVTKLQLMPPAIDTAAIDRFPTIHPKAKGLLAVTSNDNRLQRDTTDNERSLRVLCSMLLSAHQHAGAGTLSMNHLADLYTHLKYEDYDEDRLQELVRELGILRFTQSLLQLLADDLLLEEGFLPLQPRNGRKTRQLKKGF